MQRDVWVCLWLISEGLQAGVFKCQAEDGTISYQEQDCQAGSRRSELMIEKSDQQKFLRAQEKLAEDLKQRQQLEEERAESERQARELEIQQQRALAEQALIDETRLQTEAINRNTEVLSNRGYRDRVLYVSPHHPVAKSAATKSHVLKPHRSHKQTSGKVTIQLHK